MAVTLVSSYNPDWPGWFETIRLRIEPRLEGIVHGIEHVGSTSIPGMTAKAIIDIDIVAQKADFPVVEARLERLGYLHQGDRGIPEREAFDLVDEGARRELPEHHLYVCMSGADGTGT